MFAIFNVFRQDHQGLLTLLRANEHDNIDDRLAEGHVGIVLQAIEKELEQDVCLLWDPLIELTHRLNSLDLKLDAKIG